MAAVEYADDLKKLVAYQAQQGYLVLFQIRMPEGDHPNPAVFDALQAQGAGAGAGTAIVEWNGMEPFIAWQRAGYIRVVTGGLKVGTPVFRLTEEGINAAG